MVLADQTNTPMTSLCHTHISSQMDRNSLRSLIARYYKRKRLRRL